MPTPVRNGAYLAYYPTFWRWWHRDVWHGPMLDNCAFVGAPGIGVIGSPTTRGISIATGFSGAAQSPYRAVKTEIYVQDMDTNARFHVLLHAIEHDALWVRPLWEGVRDAVHRSTAAVSPSDPGVYAVAGRTRVGRATHIPASGSSPCQGAHLGVSPMPARSSIGIERAGDAGRIVAFLEDRVDLRVVADVERAAVWMASTVAVFRAVLG